MSLAKDILSGVWMIQAQYAASVMPLVESFLNGQQVDMKTLAFFDDDEEDTAYSDGSDSSDGRLVAVIPVKGVILKYSYCGTRGLTTLVEQLKDLEHDPKIGAIVLSMDTPGGEASFLPNVAQQIQSMTKPILAHYTGMCASAGVYIASQCDRIYASAPTDIYGSMGTLTRVYRANKEFDASTQEFRIDTVYATKSTKKNEAYRKSLEGDDTIMKSQILDPFTDQFHGDVLAVRPNINQEVFTGEEFMTDRAIALGAIDGMKSLDEVIAEAMEMIQNPNDMNIKQLLFPKSTQMNKNQKRISQVLGREVKAGSVLSEADMAKLAGAMATSEETADETPDDEEKPEDGSEETTDGKEKTDTNDSDSTASFKAALDESLKPIQASIAQVQKTMGTFNSRLNVVEGKPGASSANEDIEPQAGAAPSDYSKEPWNDPNSAMNQAAANDLKHL